MTSFLDRLKQETAEFSILKRLNLLVVEATQRCRAMAAHKHMIARSARAGNLYYLPQKSELPFGMKKRVWLIEQCETVTIFE